MYMYSMYIQEIFQSYQISVRFTKPLHIQQYKYRISVLHEMTGQQVIPCKSCFHVSERACVQWRSGHTVGIYAAVSSAGSVKVVFAYLCCSLMGGVAGQN